MAYFVHPTYWARMAHLPQQVQQRLFIPMDNSDPIESEIYQNKLTALSKMNLLNRNNAIRLKQMQQGIMPPINCDNNGLYLNMPYMPLMMNRQYFGYPCPPLINPYPNHSSQFPLGTFPQIPSNFPIIPAAVGQRWQTPYPGQMSTIYPNPMFRSVSQLKRSVPQIEKPIDCYTNDLSTSFPSEHHPTIKIRSCERMTQTIEIKVPTQIQTYNGEKRSKVENEIATTQPISKSQFCITTCGMAPIEVKLENPRRAKIKKPIFVDNAFLSPENSYCETDQIKSVSEVSENETWKTIPMESSFLLIKEKSRAVSTYGDDKSICTMFASKKSKKIKHSSRSKPAESEQYRRIMNFIESTNRFNASKKPNNNDSILYGQKASGDKQLLQNKESEVPKILTEEPITSWADCVEDKNLQSSSQMKLRSSSSKGSQIGKLTSSTLSMFNQQKENETKTNEPIPVEEFGQNRDVNMRYLMDILNSGKYPALSKSLTERQKRNLSKLIDHQAAKLKLKGKEWVKVCEDVVCSLNERAGVLSILIPQVYT